METIIFQQFNPKSSFPFLQLVKPQKDGSVILTGCLPRHMWEVGQDIASFHPLFHAVENGVIVAIKCKVTEVIEQRDHKGIFDQPWKKENSFFKIRVEEIEIS